MNYRVPSHAQNVELPIGCRNGIIHSLNLMRTGNVAKDRFVHIENAGSFHHIPNIQHTHKYLEDRPVLEKCTATELR